MNYDPHKIEKKWQKIWEEEGRFVTKDHVEGKENEYILIEFPYPSGIGLHLGHCMSYTATDAVVRKRRLQGKNVLFPFGTDAFGLEAERTAQKEKRLPQEIVARNIGTFQEQVKGLGLSVDWSRTINSCDPDYYKWTQWLFLQFVKHGLAEKRETLVNYCPNCGVLANEEVEDGLCCQCHSETTQKVKAQWILKMTEYAERLSDDLDKTEYLDYIKTSQKNWIGKSEGVEVDFDLVGGGKFSIFTTCIETIFGITFMVIAPESKIVDDLKPRIQNWDEVEKYRKQTAKKSEFDRSQMNKDKSGCELKGVYAINPANGEQVKVFIGDFVLAGYGTGAVMAVPTHDQRDFEFAEKYNIDMIQVIDGADVSKQAFEKQDYLGKGCKLINSEQFNGLTVEEAKEAITNFLIEKGVARKKLNSKMRDWIFARQKYWGEPIPMIYCEKCGWVPVPDDQLPVTLPLVKNYECNKEGESPLAEIPEWVNTTCPHCGAPAKRETDTMPGWAGSSWYFLRYCDPHNDKEFASMDSMKAWLPVAYYNGGNEHTNRHLLYARFWNKFFYDIGIVPVDEPFKTRISHGLILGADGKKMSKSAGNGVDPRIIVDQYGADALRLWMSFIGDHQATVSWSDDGVKACYKFLHRVWNLQDVLVDGNDYSNELSFIFHITIEKVTYDMDNIKYNTAVASLMTLLNEIYKVGKINNFEYKTLLTMLSIFAPHMCEEIWVNRGYGKNMLNAVWPVADKSKMVQDEVEIVVQINSKIRNRITVPTAADQTEVESIVKEKCGLPESQPKKTIFVKGKLINFIM